MIKHTETVPCGTSSFDDVLISADGSFKSPFCNSNKFLPIGFS